MLLLPLLLPGTPGRDTDTTPPGFCLSPFLTLLGALKPENSNLKSALLMEGLACAPLSAEPSGIAPGRSLRLS